MPLGAVAPVQMRDAIAMREAQACGLVVADQLVRECDLSFVCLGERAGEPGIAGAWGRWRWFGGARVSCFAPLLSVAHISETGHSTLARMPHATLTAGPKHKKARPVHISFLSLQAIVQIPDSFANLIQQPFGQQRGGNTVTNFVRSVMPAHAYSMSM